MQVRVAGYCFKKRAKDDIVTLNLGRCSLEDCGMQQQTPHGLLRRSTDSASSVLVRRDIS